MLEIDRSRIILLSNTLIGALRRSGSKCNTVEVRSATVPCYVFIYLVFIYCYLFILLFIYLFIWEIQAITTS